MFSCEIYKLFKNNYFEEHLWTSASKYYLKRDSNSGASSEFCKLFKNTYFLEDLQTACSETPVRGSFFKKVASLTAWKLLTVLERDSHRYFSVNFEKFLGKLFYRTPPSNHFSHDVVFYLLADQWGLQPKINSFGGPMVNQGKEFTSLFNPV